MRSKFLIIILFIFAIVIFYSPIKNFIEFTFSDIKSFVDGDPDERNLSIIDKLSNDTGLTLVRYKAENVAPITKKFVNNKSTIISFSKSSNILKTYVDDADNKLKDFYILLSAKLETNDNNDYYILIDPAKDKIIQYWYIDEDIYKKKVPDNLYASVENRFPSNIQLGPDSELYVANNSSLLRLNKCSKIDWVYPKSVHHLFGLSSDNKSLWVIQEDFFSEIDSSNGNLLKTINRADIDKANPDLYINYARLNVFKNYKLEDNLHWNDIEPLRSDNSKFFERYEADDLLISNRSENTVFILNPISLRIKDFFIGYFNRQHDPDWGPGYISVFNNNPNREGIENKGSSIVYLNVNELDKRKKYKTKYIDMYTRFEGNHDIEGDLVLATSSRSGTLKIFYKDEPIYRLDNSYKNGEYNLVINQAELIPKTFKLSSCIGQN